MDNQAPHEQPEVKRATEARQGRIVKGGAVYRVLVISLILVVVAFLLIFFVFAS